MNRRTTSSTSRSSVPAATSATASTAASAPQRRERKRQSHVQRKQPQQQQQHNVEENSQQQRQGKSLTIQQQQQQRRRRQVDARQTRNKSVASAGSSVARSTGVPITNTTAASTTTTTTTRSSTRIGRGSTKPRANSNPKATESTMSSSRSTRSITVDSVRRNSDRNRNGSSSGGTRTGTGAGWSDTFIDTTTLSSQNRRTGTTGTSAGSDPDHNPDSRSSTTQQGKWSDECVRQQLWDALRLARIILKTDHNDPVLQQQQQQQQQQAEPQRRPRLTNHTILHAICKVAEMKLQIQSFERQLLELHEENDRNTNQTTSTSTSNSTAATTTTAAMTSTTPTSPPRQNTTDSDTHIRVVTPTQTPPTPPDDDNDEPTMIVEEALSSPPSIRRGRLFPQNNNNYGTDGTHDGGGRSVDIPRHHHHNDNDGDQQRNNDDVDDGLSNFERILQGLYQKVDETSASTTAKINALHEQLADERIRRNHQQQQQEEKQSHEQQQQQQNEQQQSTMTIEMELQSLKSQLDEYKQLMGEKDVDVAVWKDRSLDLERMLLSPNNGAQQLLQKVVTNGEKRNTSGGESGGHNAGTEHGIRDHKNNVTGTAVVIDDDGDQDDADADLHTQATKLLDQMDGWNREQNHKVQELSSYLQDVQDRATQRSAEVDFLRLQRQLLTNDNDTARSNLTNDMVSTRARLETEIATIIKEEAQQLNEIQELEVELTHLAFTSVNVEDTQKDWEMKHKTEWLDELSTIKYESRQLIHRLRSFHQRIGRTVGIQSVRLGLDVVTEEEDDDDEQDQEGHGRRRNENMSGNTSVGGGSGSKIGADDKTGGYPHVLSTSLDSDTDSTTTATTVTSLAGLSKDGYGTTPRTES